MACSDKNTDVVENDVYIVGSYSGLLAGNYDGLQSVYEVGKHGDFGLGCYDALDGELILLDGAFYQATADGTVRIANDDQSVPYAALVFFDEDTVLAPESDEIFDPASLEVAVRTLSNKRNLAFKITGTFQNITLRAPRKQVKPYPPLEEAIIDQSVWEFENLTGTMVGFVDLDNTSNENNWHFHFISDDKQYAGHILDFAIEHPVIAKSK